MTYKGKEMVNTFQNPLSWGVIIVTPVKASHYVADFYLFILGQDPDITLVDGWSKKNPFIYPPISQTQGHGAESQLLLGEDGETFGKWPVHLRVHKR